MLGNLRRAARSEGVSQLLVGAIVVSRESIRDFILVPGEPLAVVLDSIVQLPLGIIPAKFESARCLDGIFNQLAEV